MVSRGQVVAMTGTASRGYTAMYLFKSHLGLGFFRVYVSPRIYAISCCCCCFYNIIPVLACGLQIILKLLFLAYSSYLCKRTLLFGVVANLSIPALSRSVTQPRHLWLTVCGAHLFFHRQIPVDNSMILLVSISFRETPWHQGWGFCYFLYRLRSFIPKSTTQKGAQKY